MHQQAFHCLQAIAYAPFPVHMMSTICLQPHVMHEHLTGTQSDEELRVTHPATVISKGKVRTAAEVTGGM